MAEQEISYDAIIRTEIAIEILNQARAIVTARVYQLEGTYPEAAETMALVISRLLSPTDKADLMEGKGRSARLIARRKVRQGGVNETSP